MIHRTFRSLDQAPKLLGFSFRQWLWLLLGGGSVLALILLLHISTRPALTLLVFMVGLPAALAYVSESGGLALGALLLDVVRWRLSPQLLDPSSPATRAPMPVLILAPSAPLLVDEPGVEAPADGDPGEFWERWE